MSWLTSNVSRFFRGSSGDEVEEGRLTAHSTPRLSRARVRDVNVTSGHHPPRHFGSLGDMEVHRVNPAPNRMRERSWESERMHSVTQQLHPSQQALLNRSWDIDRPPPQPAHPPPPGVPGLDRAWELERARGLEMLHRSAEKERERRIAQAHSQPHAAHARGKDPGKPGKKRKKDKKKESQTMMEQIDNNKLEQERLERRIDELNRMLLEEKHGNRKDKLAVAKLQQEVARQKSERNIRETVTKEFEREKMLRIETERKLQMVSIENDNNQARLHALHAEFQKMEEMVRGLLQCKNKVDQLKQEKATLAISFEKNMQKCRTEISHLEHENKIVMAELKRLEQQCMNCEQCNKDLSYRVTKNDQSEHSDKVKVLLERLKRLEEEKSALVLENEKQRHHYEKCLDEIANQVVHALLSQKGLREECGKLQKRVLDLEDQNRQLRDMFHHRLKFSSDSLLQGVCVKSAIEPSSQGKQAVMGGSCDSITPLSHISLGSLHSICSNYQETAHTEENEPGKPKPSSPPPWLRDHINNSDSPSLSSPATVDTVLAAHGAHGVSSAASLPGQEASLPVSSVRSRTADNPQPRFVLQQSAALSAFHPVTSNHMTLQAFNQNSTATHVTSSAANQNVTFHGQLPIQMHMSQTSTFIPPTTYPRKPSSQDPSSPVVTLDNYSPSEVDYKIISSIQNAKKRFSQSHTLTQGESNQSPCEGHENSQGLTQSDGQSQSKTSGDQARKGKSGDTMNMKSNNCDELHRNEGEAELKNANDSRPKPIKLHLSSSMDSASLSTKGTDISPGKKLMKMSDSFPEKFTLNERDGMPKISDFCCDSDSDESTNSKALSNNFSMASTMSLTELLERGLDSMKTPSDETFSMDTFQMFDSEDESKDNERDTGLHTNSTQTGLHANGSKYLMNKLKDEKSEIDYGDYVCLRKIREYVYVNMPDLMGGKGQGEVKGHKDSCKSSQACPELEAICDCGSCDRLYEEKQELKKQNGVHHDPDPYAKPTQVVSRRPQNLELKSTTHISGGPLSSGSRKIPSGSTSWNFPPNPNAVQSHYSSGYRRPSAGDYVNVSPGKQQGEGDYVNITPQQVQRILSVGSVNSPRAAPHTSAHGYTRLEVPRSPVISNVSAADQHAKKMPPPVKPKPRLVDTKFGENRTDPSNPEAEIRSNGSSCCSPDSAMQKSYTSTDSAEISENRSENRTLERLRYGRDEGYSSNSANSIKAESESSGIRKSASSEATLKSDENANNNNKKSRFAASDGKVHVEAEIHAHYEHHHLESTSGAAHPFSKSVPKPSAFLPQGAPSHQEKADKLHVAKAHSPAALTLTHCSRSHRHKRSHSTSCCLRSRTLAEFHSFLLKRSFSDCNLEKTILCLKAMQHAKQKASTLKNARQTVTPMTPKSYPLMTANPHQTQPTKWAREEAHLPHFSAQRYANPAIGTQPIYANVTPFLNKAGNGATQDRLPAHDSPYSQQVALRMGVSAGAGKLEERRADGSEHGYQSRDELRPAEGTVTSQYEEAGPSNLCDVIPEQKNQLFFNITDPYVTNYRPHHHQEMPRHNDPSFQPSNVNTAQTQCRQRLLNKSITSPESSSSDLPPFWNNNRDCFHQNVEAYFVLDDNRMVLNYGPYRSESESTSSGEEYVTCRSTVSSKQHCKLPTGNVNMGAPISTSSQQLRTASKQSHVKLRHRSATATAQIPEIAPTNENTFSSTHVDRYQASQAVPHTQTPPTATSLPPYMANEHRSLQPKMSGPLHSTVQTLDTFQDHLSPGETRSVHSNPQPARGMNPDIMNMNSKTTTISLNTSANKGAHSEHPQRLPPKARLVDLITSVNEHSRDEPEPASNASLTELVQECDEMVKLMDEYDPEYAVDCDSQAEGKGQGQMVSSGSQRTLAESHDKKQAKEACGFLETLILLSSSSEEDSAAPHCTLLPPRTSCLEDSSRSGLLGNPFSLSLELSPSPTHPSPRPHIDPTGLTHLSPTSFYGPTTTCNRPARESTEPAKTSPSTDRPTKPNAEESNVNQKMVAEDSKLDQSTHDGSVSTKLTESFCDKYRKTVFCVNSETESLSESDMCVESFKSAPGVSGHAATSGCHGFQSASHTHAQGELESGDDCASLSEEGESSVCECEDLDQCPHARQYVLSTVDPSSCSYHTDNSDASVSYFFEPPLHPRVCELKEENRLEQDYQVRRVSNAVFEPTSGGSYTAMASHYAGTHYEDIVDSAVYGHSFDERDEYNLLEDSDNLNNMQNQHDHNRSTCVIEDHRENSNDLDSSPERSPMFRRACALRLGGRTCSFDSETSSVCNDGLSLSDSCCESAEE